MLKKLLPVLLLIATVAIAAETGVVRVAVWGAVMKPGQYRLSGTPDLLEIISAGGGPAPGADLSRILILREIDGSRKRINLDRITTSGTPYFLTSGDVVVVPESVWRGIQRNLPVVTALATLVNLAIAVVLIIR